MQIERILQNQITLLTSEVNQGKTMVLVNLVREYVLKYTGNVYAYGLHPKHYELLPMVRPFYSVLELEQIQNGVIIIDEVASLFDLNNRKEHRMIEKTLRMTAHHNNKIVMAGLPDNFRKFLSALATGFMYKSLNLGSLINGSHIKYTLEQYRLAEMGAFTLSVPKDQVLCYSEVPIKGSKFWLDTVTYFEEFDTKIGNSNLFEPRKEK
jgi:hypothetical protein